MAFSVGAIARALEKAKDKLAAVTETVETLESALAKLKGKRKSDDVHNRRATDRKKSRRDDDDDDDDDDEDEGD